MSTKTLDTDSLAILRLIRDKRNEWRSEGCHAWKHKPEEIGITRRDWRRLLKAELVESRGFGVDLTFAGKHALALSEGTNLFEGIS